MSQIEYILGTAATLVIAGLLSYKFGFNIVEALALITSMIIVYATLALKN